MAQMAQFLQVKVSGRHFEHILCLNCPVSSLAWLSTEVIFVWTWHFPFEVLVRIGSSCCKLLSVCIKLLLMKIMYMFYCNKIAFLYNLAKYYRNRFTIKKVYCKQEWGELFWKKTRCMQCVYLQLTSLLLPWLKNLAAVFASVCSV